MEVTIGLNKNPQLNTSYGVIEEELTKLGKDTITIKDVSNSNIVCKIRMSKLPDPQLLGNAGSFFKNPEVSIEVFDLLNSQISDLPGYKIS